MLNQAKPSTRRMLPQAYADMRARLCVRLQQFGIWTNAEIDMLAEFVEKEICLDRCSSSSPAKPLLNEGEAMTVLQSSKLPPEIWLHALRSTFTDKRLIEGLMRDLETLRIYSNLVDRASKK